MLDLSKVWPEWTAEEKLGEGAYGSVYKCVRRERGITSYCAIKKISVPHEASEAETLKLEGFSEEDSKEYFDDIVDSFVNEIGVMENLKGFPNIVSVEDYKIVEHENSIGWDIYIRMELLTSFKNYIQSKQLNGQDVIKLGVDICSALEICEKHGVLHRDVKPDNIFLDKNGNFKLGDFGVARQLERTRSTMSDKGTPAYVAPEVVKERKYDHRVDIYSLGMVMYKLLNKNRDPFLDTEKQMIRAGERFAANERRINGDEMNKPVDASEKTAEIILKACSYNPDNRFASAREMKSALQNLDVSVPDPVEDKPAVDPVVKELLNEETITEFDADTKKQKPTQKNLFFSSHAIKKIAIVSVALLGIILTAIGIKSGILNKKAFEETTSQISTLMASVTTQKETRYYSFAFQDPVETTAAGFIETYCEATALYSDGRILKVVEFGSYPKYLVDDSDLIDELNNLELDWKSYGYYSGDGLLMFGSMKPSNYMEYADVEYNGSKYRAVWIKDYRPLNTLGEHTVLSDQYNNGYLKDNVYWFSFEPILWGIVNEEEGYLISMDVIDAQPLNNEMYLSIYGDIYYSNSEKTNATGDYETSSVRSWLNNEFYNTAFTEKEKLLIKTTLIDNDYYDTESMGLGFTSETYDKVFLPSYNDVYEYLNDDNTIYCNGTDYAESQALTVNSDTNRCSWLLRTSGDKTNSCCVSIEGTIESDKNSCFISGIRPALCVENP